MLALPQVSKFLCCLLGLTVPFQDRGTEAPCMKRLETGSLGTGTTGAKESGKPAPAACKVLR